MADTVFGTDAPRLPDLDKPADSEYPGSPPPKEYFVIPVIDLFAGPGGLNEGFSRLGEAGKNATFETIGSFEMDPVACRTLRLRHTFHSLARSEDGVPDAYYEFVRGQRTLDSLLSVPEVADAHGRAVASVHQIELGTDRSISDELIKAALTRALPEGGDWVLVGGPPCQAYSLVGRSRRSKDDTFEDDKKHFLYREYLHILETFEPPVFVMENVKGLLSSTNRGTQMFEMIRSDLEGAGTAGYDLYSFVVDSEPSDVKPGDFVIRAENYGVPQKRHRVILLGVRRGFRAGQRPGQLAPVKKVSVADSIGHLPPVRSGISPVRADSLEGWRDVREAARVEAGLDPAPTSGPSSRGAQFVQHNGGSSPTTDFEAWISDSRIGGYIQHESRSHMESDLRRYYFAARKARELGRSPKLDDFPRELLPKHANIDQKDRPFDDRFRVQVNEDPATTVTSHISKDGHYYIHPDEDQMRSLTVREAARLQSFPDNYFFAGNRTQQYHQVGNAVPPLLAYRLAEIVAAVFTEAVDDPAAAEMMLPEPAQVMA
ncbi:DNA cytosine methyltransferase [Agromyces sp. NPDC058064]|uniref:DNA cytosine methyltransferase n=1 Tax=Agromyces sp. NPDC058064 TaxID=3346322 RepID=UPI0036DB2B74